MSWRDLTDDLKDRLLAWWSVARKGEVVSIVLDSDNRYMDLVKTAVNAGALTLGVNSVSGLAKGAVLLVRSSDGLDGEHVVVSSLTTGIITLTDDLNSSFAVDSVVRSKFYWPFCITTDKSLNIALSDLKAKRWNLSLSFKEEL